MLKTVISHNTPKYTDYSFPTPALVHKQIAVINLCNLCPRLLFTKISGQANIPLKGRFEPSSIQNFIGRVYSQKLDGISNKDQSSYF